jgi:flagellar hook-associated protein 1 FlgK
VPDILQTGISGLRAFQAALATTSHNVANVATDGFTRQRVDISTREPESTLKHSIGTGAKLTDVRRVYDQFVVDRLRQTTGRVGEHESLSGLSARLDELLSADGTGLAGPLDDLNNALHDLSTDPASIPGRQVVLTQAQALVERVGGLERAMNEFRFEVQGRLDQSVGDVNALASEIAGINRELINLPGGASGQVNDLLDRRDLLLADLSALVGVRAVTQDSAQINVFLESGEALVVGTHAHGLATVPNPMDPGAHQIVYLGNNGIELPVREVSNGSVGGLVRFQNQVLNPAQDDLGRIAVNLADRFNTQHQLGMDLRGQLGTALFAVADPTASAHPDNVGGAAVQLAIVDTSALQASDYDLRFDGTDYSLERQSDGSRTSLSGAGPFLVDGMEIQLDVSGGAAVAGDRFALKQTRNAASGFELLLGDPAAVAAAGPVRTSAASDNLGEAQVSEAEILDPSDPNLLRSLEIRFADPPSTFDVVDLASATVIAASQPYVDGGDIDINGLRVQISANPEAADSFRIEANGGGVGDNRNALAMAALMDQPWLESGAASIREAAAGLVSQVGASARSAQVGLEAHQAVESNLQDHRDSISGVNLDEEAADLLRFQQAYQAAAQIIQVSNQLFQSILAAVAR